MFLPLQGGARHVTHPLTVSTREHEEMGLGTL